MAELLKLIRGQDSPEFTEAEYFRLRFIIDPVSDKLRITGLLWIYSDNVYTGIPFVIACNIPLIVKNYIDKLTSYASSKYRKSYFGLKLCGKYLFALLHRLKSYFILRRRIAAIPVGRLYVVGNKCLP